MSDTGQVSIRVLFFGAARDVVDANPLEISLDAPATVWQCFSRVWSRGFRSLNALDARYCLQ